MIVQQTLNPDENLTKPENHNRFNGFNIVSHNELNNKYHFPTFDYH